MAKITTFEKDCGGTMFTFETREVKIKNGREKIGTVDVFAPDSLETLGEYIDAGFETEQHAMKLYKGALAVELQAAARRSKTSGKMSEADFGRLYNQLTPEQRNVKNFDAVKAAVIQLWNDEHKATEDVESIEDE